MKYRPLILAALLSASNLTQAGGVPVIDIAGIAKQIQQLKEMQLQFEHMKKEFEAITGNRGMEKLLNSESYNKTRDYIPATWQEAMALANKGDAGKYSNLQKGMDYMNKNGNTAIDAMDVEQSVKDSLKSANNNANGFMVMSGAVFDTTGKRAAKLQSLITAIGSATDPKAIADLNARINAENLLINNEMVKIQAMQVMQQAKLQQMRNTAVQRNITRERANNE